MFGWVSVHQQHEGAGKSDVTHSLEITMYHVARVKIRETLGDATQLKGGRVSAHPESGEIDVRGLPDLSPDFFSHALAIPLQSSIRTRAGWGRV
jgi:hypothetical protein